MAERAFGDAAEATDFEGGFLDPLRRGHNNPFGNATHLPTGAGGGGGATYRMRGFDQNGAVNSIVYWNATTVDSAAASYTGSAGPVVDIVVKAIVGA
jgi:hypothetical protein